ncbi:MAG: type I-U CRISPR-associated helicase/endonuclease Cas3 [Micrococcus sp.]|nr:type I-U CRISPR-associated helicase/endonuclease Cas3 [Micrococcus sp.]
MTSPQLTLDDFDAWFAAVNHGRQPYSWQRDLMRRVVHTGRWPSALVAPTGSGKSSVIDIHVFAVAVTAHRTGADRVPRRLVHVVGRRALVDDAGTRARRILELLNQATSGEGDDVVARVAQELRSVAPGDEPIGVSVLRGGLPPERGWQDDAVSCQIICATPDMLGSRLLFRGYGSTPGMRPREAGLLAYDSALVVDEAHLNRQLLCTARRVAELATESPLASVVPVLQVVETTATPSSSTAADDAVSISLDDVRRGSLEPDLAARLTRPKRVHIHTDQVWLPGTTGTKRSARVQRVADLAATALAAGKTPVGIVLNRVASAVDVWQALRQRLDEHADADIRLLVGPRRRWEQHRDADHAEPAVYVATQTVEVGVDLDFGTLITDLAPGTALAQRAGRLNRTGLRAEADVHVLVPDAPLTAKNAHVAPYAAADMEAGLDWVRRLAETPEGLAPVSVMATPPPPVAPQRLALTEIEAARAELLAMTSEQFPVEPDLTFYLRDSLDADSDLVVMGRRLPRVSESSLEQSALPPVDDDAALAVLKAAPPQWHEAYPTTVAAARQWLDGRRNPDIRSVYLLRDGEWAAIERSSAAQELRAGSVICLPAEARAAQGAVFMPEGLEPIGDVLDPRDAEGERRALPGASGSARHTVLCTGEEVDGVAPHIRQSVLEVALEASMEPGSDGADVDTVHDALVERGQSEQLQAMLRHYSDGTTFADHATVVTVGTPAVEVPSQASWIVFSEREGPDVADDVLSVVSPHERVYLDDHQRDVAARAAGTARALGLPEPLVLILETAGLHHDDGKADPRFQAWLSQAETAPPERPLAKSGHRTLPLLQRHYVPQGWRHEQLSVAIALAEDPSMAALTQRLIGTSHGYGRGLFAMSAEELLAPEIEEAVRDAAVRLYSTGHWDSLIDQTHREWGVWGTAWLEAVLRSADVTISKEGR